MRVLCVGLACFDVIQVCDRYPTEDTDQRSLECRLQRGGNAANNCTVLSLLGVPADFLGTLASGPFYEYLKNDFGKYNIGIDNCKVYDDCECPLSNVLINSKNGSRTIVHSNKNLPEISFSDFDQINLTDYSWIHFEGRNTEEIKKMMKYIVQFNEKNQGNIIVSVELEKPKFELLELVPTADVIFVGKDFSIKNGWLNIESTLTNMKEYVRESAIVLSTWGEKGAGIMCPQGMYLSAAYTPDKIVDTLGAGDSFCAAVIYALLHKKSPKDVILYASRIAGHKVGIPGYDGLANLKSHE